MGRKIFRLVLDPQAGEDILTLPLARIMRDGSGHFIFDPTFIPPCLQISASARLTTMLQRLVEILEDKSEVVAQDQQQASGKFQTGMSARQVSQFWFLHAINS